GNGADGQQMQRQRQQVGREGDGGGGEVEGQEEGRQQRRPGADVEAAFLTGSPLVFAAPKLRRGAPGGPGREGHEERADETQEKPWARVNQDVEQGGKRRLVEPDVAIQRLARQHGARADERIGLFNPQHVEVAEADGGEQRDGQNRREAAHGTPGRDRRPPAAHTSGRGPEGGLSHARRVGWKTAMELELEAGSGDAGLRVDHFLAARLPGYSRARLQEWIEAGRVSVNGAPARKASLKLRGGERIVVQPAERKPLRATPEE